MHRAATASFAESHRAAHERRLAAIDVAWKAALELGELGSSGVVLEPDHRPVLALGYRLGGQACAQRVLVCDNPITAVRTV